VNWRNRFLLWVFHRLYNEWAPLYDLVSRVAFLGEWQNWQAAAIPAVRGPRVLEIGFGTGDLLVQLDRRGFESYGLDASFRMAQIATRKAQRQEAVVNLLLGRAQALPFSSGSLGTVICTFPAEYVHDPLAWAEVARVLRPEGRFIVVDGGRIRPRGPLSALHSLLFDAALGPSSTDRPILPDRAGPFRFIAERWSNKAGEVWVLTGQNDSANEIEREL
jgi:ubiquinone/menaquinone biosynthesis C-methylase UbiE